MKWFLLPLLALAVLAPAARADVPPPTGTKYVAVQNEVTLSKDVTGYVFVQSVGHGPGAPRTFGHRIDLPPGQPVKLPEGGRYTYLALYAVPEAAAKEFKTDSELFEALQARKVKGAHSVGFAGCTTTSILRPGSSVSQTHTITAITEKGIQMKGQDEDAEKPDAKSEKKERPSVLGGACVSGSAFALALFLGGLWLVRRAGRD